MFRAWTLSRWFFSVALLMAVAMTATLLTAEDAGAAIDTFGDGTEVEVTIDSPADGSTPTAGTALLEGTARVGAGNSPPDTSLVVVYDLSGSTLDPAGGDCGGDTNGDGRSNTILDCEIAAMEALEQTAASLGSVSEMGVVLFERSSAAADVQPESGIQRLTAPGADLNSNGTSDIAEVVRTSRWTSGWFSADATVDLFTFRNAGSGNGGTNYAAGLSTACETLAATSQPNRTIVFLSDGGANTGGDVTTVLPCSQTATVHSVAVGANSTCAADPTGRGSLQEVADLTGGTCTEVIAPEDLPDILSGIISPDLVALGLSVNGGPQTDITAAASVPLPAPGPDPVQWAYEVTDLQGPEDEICVTAYAQRDIELVDVTECITLVSNRPPVADAGEDRTVAEGSLIELDGTASADPDGDPLTYEWSIISQTGSPIVVSSTTDPVAGFIAFDDGTYTFQLTVSDGRVADSDTVEVTVANAAPSASALAEPASEGGVALLTASFTDPGLLDTHTATIDWGDGSGPAPVAISAQGNGWGSLFGTHTYDDAGSFTATITITDDDGGVDVVESVAVEVRDSLALWANSRTAGRTINWTGGIGTVDGLVHSNKDLRVRGDDKLFDGRVEYVGANSSGANVVFSDAPVRVQPADPPVHFHVTDYRPGGRAAVDAGDAYHDMSAACGARWDPVGPLAEGLYYVPCDVKLNASALAGTVTIAAEGEIQVSGDSADFEPFVDGLLFLSAAATDKAVQISSADSTYLGYLHAIDGRIDLSGSGNTYLCGILGDRIDISDDVLSIRASDCIRPERTVAPPTLVPDLDVAVDVSPDEAQPGTVVTTATTLANTGSLLLVPGVVGVENLGDDAVTVTDVALGIEYLPVGGSWTPLAESISVTSQPNPAAGVTFPADGGFDGTVVDPDGLATWGAEMQVFLPAATVEMLLDDTRTAAVRNTFAVELDNPTSAPVRSLFRFGNDFAAELRALGGSLTDAQVVTTGIDGTTAVIDAATEPALASLAPGDAATVALQATVPVPEPRGVGEPVDAYLARLAALDGTSLNGSAFALSTGGVGSVLGGFESDSATRVVPIVDLGLTGTESLVAGDPASFAVDLRNVGSAAATAVAVSASVDGVDTPVGGVPVELAPGQIEGAAFGYGVPVDQPTGVLPVEAVGTWQDANGNAYGDVERRASVIVATPPDLSALMADELLADADGNGLPSPGDTIRYRVTITNRGATPAEGVALALTPDAASTLLTGSVTASPGTVLNGNGAGDTAVGVDVGVIAPMTSAEITFDVLVAAGAAQISAQGLITSDTLPDVLTDDPGEAGAQNPTVTIITDTPPSLQAAMVVRLAVDADTDDLAGPSDTLEYAVQVTNSGLSSATDVVVVAEPDPLTSLVVGSVDTLGEVLEGNTPGDARVVVRFDEIVGLERANVVFRATLVDPLPAGTSVISLQGTVSSAELPDVLTDDPSVPGSADPTVVTVTTTTGGAGGTGGPGDDGSTWGTAGGFSGTTPDSGAEVRVPVGIRTSISPPDGTTVDSWTVVTYPVGGNRQEGLVLAEGTGDPPAGDLATLDPSLLANGSWVVRIQVTDSAGGIGVDETVVSVQGGLKLGRFTTTYQDATVSVGGIPLLVRRTYDTTQRFSSGDFGYGWTLDVADFEVATNRRLGEGPWTVEACGSGFIFVPLCWTPEGKRVVTVTWPGGRVESFDFTPTGNSFFSFLTTMEYSPQRGTTSTLRPAPGDETGGFVGGNVTDNFFIGDVYDPQRFVLTAVDGTEYLLDTRIGLVQATDLSGNTVTYGDDGIISSRGASLLFDRDAEGRITRVTQPDGATVTYAYDTAGDLIGVTNQNGRQTVYGYSSGHYLSVIDDPGGGALQTMTYGPDGRLASVTDAGGNTVTITSDLQDRSTIITSPDGRRTVVTTFDERGNRSSVEDIYDGQSHVSTFAYSATDQVTRRTDPLGNVFVAEYDDDDNLTSFVDAEGNVTSFTYDDRGLPVHQVDPVGAELSFAYDAAGRVVSVTDGRGGVQSYTYDAAGNMTSRTDQIGRTWTWTYDPAGRLTGETDPRGNTTTFDLDANGRPIAQVAPDGGVTSYSYDAVGNLLSVADPLGQTTTYTYDEGDRLASITDPAGFTQTFTHNGDGLITSRTDEVGNTWSYSYAFDRLATATSPDGATMAYTYDGAGRLASLTDPLGRVRTYTHDPNGRRTSWTLPIGDGGSATTLRTFDGNGDLVAVTNPEGETTTFELDGRRRVIAETDPLGRTSTTTYDLWGNVTSETDPSGATTTYGYDLANQLTETVDAIGATTTYSYDPAGNLASLTDPLGRTTTFTYDEVNRLTGRTLPTGDTATTGYDLAGRISVETSAAGYSSSVDRDPRGLVTAMTDALGNTVSHSYDPARRLVGRTDARGNTTTYDYDSNGRLVSETDPLGGTVSYGWDLAGQQTAVTDANGAVRLTGYDDGGRTISETDALGRTTTHAYDDAGRRISTTDPRGVVTDRTFDGAGQLTGESADGHTRSFTYDAVGRRTQMVDATGTTDFVYDAVGRLLEIDAPGGTVSYEWNLAGERDSMTQPEGVVTYDHDPNGRLQALTDWRGDVAGFVHDADGRLLEVTRGNGIDSALDYDDAGRMVGITHLDGAGVVDAFAYTLDADGNRVGVDGSRGTESYTIDALNRITAARYADGTSESFVYDAAGHRVSHTDVAGVTTGYDIDAAGQIVSDSTGVTYSYDAAGNLTGTSDGDSFTYDVWGELSAATVNGVSQTYATDGSGVRVAVDGVAQVWDRAGGLPTLISTGDGHSVVHGPSGVVREDDQWLLGDALGSVRAAADDDGTITAERSYTAFGEARDGTAGATLFGFAGEQEDATGRVHLRARTLDPALGRFLSPDPLQPGASGTPGWNLYAYAANNPTTWSDPSGMFQLGEYAAVVTQTTVRTLPLLLRVFAWVLLFFIIAIHALMLFIPFFDGDGNGDGNPDGGDDPDNPGPDTPQPQQPRDPLQDLADQFGTTPEAIRDCLASGLGSAACDGLHEDLLEYLREYMNRGDGRDCRGRFAGGCGFGEEAQRQGLEDYANETGRDVVPEVNATHPDADTGRRYDGLAQKEDGTWEGIEIKSGSSPYGGSQEAFDSNVSYDSPATATVNGQTVQITSVTVIRVP